MAEPDIGHEKGPVPSLRRRDMLRHIERQGAVSVAELVQLYGVSAVTVHRDLEVLAGAGEVERVRGGARAIARVPGIDSDFHRRRWSAQAAKQVIAREAARMVEEGMTIFLDSSTTCLALATELGRGAPPAITLVTNSPAIAYELKAPAVHIVLTPGEVDQDLMLIGGRWTVEFILRVQLEIAFISGAALTLDQGLATRQRDISDVLSAVQRVARRTVALVDSSKFGALSLMTIAPATELDTIIVDDGLPAQVRRDYQRAGVALSIADGAVDELPLEPAELASSETTELDV